MYQNWAELLRFVRAPGYCSVISVPGIQWEHHLLSQGHPAPLVSTGLSRGLRWISASLCLLGIAMRLHVYLLMKIEGQMFLCVTTNPSMRMRVGGCAANLFPAMQDAG